MRVALVHDWLIHMRGGEKVLEALAEVFPDATIYTLFSNRKKISPSLQRMKVQNSWLHSLPGIRSYYRWLLPILPCAIRTLRIEPVDLVISSNHCVAKGVRLPPGVRHFSYCHTPMRYLWGFEEEYFGNLPKWFRRLLDPVFKRLRQWDRAAANTVDEFICNSEAVRERIKNIYGRDAQVIHPPVDTQFFAAPLGGKRKGGDDYYLIVSALTPYKRIDVAIEAFNALDRPLVIAGDGEMRRRYEALVQSKKIRFLGKVTDEKLRDLYRGANALIFPQEEDFGIAPLEAQACGTPVIAYAKGGALESVDGGVFFYEQTPEALRAAVIGFERRSFDPEKLRAHASQFDKAVFKHKIRQSLESFCRGNNENFVTSKSSPHRD